MIESIPEGPVVAAPRAERRLAAILAADVVGYSHLMERDERGTLARLKAFRGELVEPLVAGHRGRVVKLMGDGILCEFASAVDAVECAVAIQDGMAGRERDLPEEERVRLRVGINLGDVIVEPDGDLYGDGVNIAARLEQLAPPGGTVLSGTAFDQVEGKLDLAFEPLGEQRVKNIERPVRAYRVGPGPATAPAWRARAGPPAGPERRPALAVLPFTNMSRDPEQDYFADGLTEDLITALSAWRSFPVIARNSTFTYKGRAVRVQQVAEELGARYVLEGSVRRAGGRVRVTAQLIDAETGHHVWADKFDRTLDDIFEVQDEITRKIATILAPEMAIAERKRAGLKRPEDLTAWDLHLRGMAELQKETCEGNAAARALFERAVERESGYGEAWAGLAHTHLRDIGGCCTGSRERSLAAAFEAARRAVELDEGSALAHFILSGAYVWREDLETGLAELERALELNPYHAHAQMALGNRLDLVGRAEEGVAQMERSLDLNPRDPVRFGYMASLARAHLAKGEPETAETWMRKALLLRPEDPDLHFRHAVCLAHLDRVEEARAALAEAERLRPGYLAQRAAWRPYRDEARNERFFAGLKCHGLWPPSGS
jgi:adenylate cyclase